MTLNTYVHFNGNCEEALNFYAKALDGKIAFMLRYSESPMAQECSKELGPKIMHGQLVAGSGSLMASDCPPQFYQPAAGFSISVNIDTVAEAEKYFAALSEGAKEIRMPLGETFWAERFGMFVDKFGIAWMINCEKKRA